MTSVLVIGSLRDGPTKHTLQKLHQLGHEPKFLDMHRVYEHAQLKEIGQSKIVQDGSVSLDVTQFSSVYQRLMLEPSLVGESSQRSVVHFNILRHWLLDLHNHGKRIINPPFPDDANSSKMRQLTELAEFGLKIPSSIMTNDPEAAREFCRTNKATIYKSCSSERSIVSLTPPIDSDRFTLLSNAPTLFQSYIDGLNIRVHCVGEICFAEAIETNAVDYRYSDTNTHSAIKIPLDISKALKRYMKKRGLHLVGADFRLNPITGEWIILEVNTMPGYSGYDERANFAISNALIALLTSQSCLADRHFA